MSNGLGRLRWWVIAAMAAIPLVLSSCSANDGGTSASVTTSTTSTASSAPSGDVSAPDSAASAPDGAPTSGGESTEPAEGAVVSGEPTPTIEPGKPSDGPPTAGSSIPSSAILAGNVDQTVDAGSEVVNAPVAATATGDVGASVTARITEVGSKDVTAVLPGEVGGNVVAVTVAVTNGSDKEISLDSSTVVLTDGSGNAASSVTSDPARPLTGLLKPGEEVTGLYLFTVQPEARSGMSLTVSSAPGEPTALFQGVNSA